MKKLLTTAAALLFCGSLFSQNLETFLKDSLDVYVTREMKRWNIPGVSVCVVQNGKVLTEKGFGVLQTGGTEKVNEHTLFMIGSNTKAFTATALVGLAFKGKCLMKDPVQKYVPSFTMRDPWVASHVTLTDILCHRMGMETFQGDFTYWSSTLTDAQCIEKFGKLKPLYGFRTVWGYTNMGFLLAGTVTEKITGKTWADHLSESILKPLDMSRTIPLMQDGKNPGQNVARPHTIVLGALKQVPINEIKTLSAAGSMWSSAHDMSHWVIAQLDSGRYNGTEVIPREVIEATRNPMSIIGRDVDPAKNQHYALYGLGWGLEDFRGREIVSHTGGVDGFVSSVTLLPEDQLGIVVLTNTDANSFFENLKWQIMEAHFKTPYENKSAKSYERYRTFQDAQDSEIRAWQDSVARGYKQNLPLKAFTGTWKNEVYGTVTLIQKGEALEMSFSNHPDMTAKLESLSEGRFLCTYSDPLFGVKVFPFETEGKKVKAFTLSCADFVEFTPYRFTR